MVAMAIPLLPELFRWLTTLRRDQTLDARASEDLFASELEQLAMLMDDVLKATGSDGRLVAENVHDLQYRCRRVWNRWCAIADSRGHKVRDAQTQAELERCIEIAHAAPGAYVREVYLVKMALSEGYVSPDVRVRFSESIDRLRNLAVKMRLNH
jgi:hypothetical protein